jgi:2-C-methyl-D-erythritol 2,4-cyclodiphosphate synthase/2-C-methyl-D-erythritol 4-phosphate cytidylyltransferase
MVGGLSVLQRTLTAFSTHPAISRIVIAAGEDELERVRGAVVAFIRGRCSTPIDAAGGAADGSVQQRSLSIDVTAVGDTFSASVQPSSVTTDAVLDEVAASVHQHWIPIDVVVGGETRSASVRNGLDLLTDEEVVLVHDAARPLVSHEVIDRVIEATLRTGAAVPGLPLSDTVKRMDEQHLVRATVPRAAEIAGQTLTGLTAVQTPQGAFTSNLRRAYAEYDFSASEPTDEASLIEAIGGQVEIAHGDPANIKITRQEDIALAERLLGVRSLTPNSEGVDTHHLITSSPNHLTIPETRTGFGYDVHAFAPTEAGRKLMLGGVEIPHEQGLEGHSDADVLLHAICDALLGAVSLGDIGILFPNTDEAYRGISSLRLLEIVGERVAEAGWTIVNIDATVVAEAPKLMPHRLEMQRRIGECLGIGADRVSVKATTSEKLGFVGRREGMAAWAVATVRQRMIA